MIIIAIQFTGIFFSGFFNKLNRWCLYWLSMFFVILPPYIKDISRGIYPLESIKTNIIESAYSYPSFFMVVVVGVIITYYVTYKYGEYIAERYFSEFIIK